MSNGDEFPTATGDEKHVRLTKISKLVKRK